MNQFRYIIATLICAISLTVSGQDFKLPRYEKFKLPNGLTVYLMEQHEVPMISISMILPAGAIYDEDKAGLASLTAKALKHGTQHYTKQQLDEELDFAAASIYTGTSKEYATIEARFASKDQQKILGILKEVVTAPSFDTSEYFKERKRALVALEQVKESPRSVIVPYFDKFLFGNHVYGNIASGTISSVQGIQPTDIKQFYAAHYIPNGSAIAIVGDFNPKEMRASIISTFGSWKKGKPVDDKRSIEAAIPPTKSRVLLINKEDAKETTFIIGGTGVPFNNSDKIAIDVINTLFGGRFTSMLNDELRVNTGLTYGARSTFNYFKNNGTFGIFTFTASKNTEAAIDKALEVSTTLHDKGIDQQALTSAKNYVKGQFPPGFETNSQLADLLTDMFWFNFNESYINNFQKTVDGLTLEKAKEIINKYFPKDKLQFVLVGKASEIRKIAEKYGEVKEVQITEEPPKKAF